jgi:predicted nucleotidyltransferase
MEPLTQVLERDARVSYALLFGSAARGVSHAGSDLDIAVGLHPGTTYSTQALGSLIADLERAAGCRVDLVVLNDAPPPVAYRVFRDGAPLFVRDASVMARQKARAILDYLDFRPLEQLAARGALAAAARG